MALKVVLCLALPLLSGARRASVGVASAGIVGGTPVEEDTNPAMEDSGADIPPQNSATEDSGADIPPPSHHSAMDVPPLSYQASLRTIEARYGVPKLSVLRTSSAEDVTAFLPQWSTAKDFGLFVYMLPSSIGLFQQRVAIVGISRGAQVLLYDMRPFLLQAPRPLPEALEKFLENEARTFFGLGLLRSVAQLTREFGVQVQVIDLKVRGWLDSRDKDYGLYHAADRLLGVSLPHRQSLHQLSGQSTYAHLQWAVAEKCRKAYGEPETAWILSAQELSDAKAVKLRARRSRYYEPTADDALHEQEAHAEQELSHIRAMRTNERRGMRKIRRERSATAREIGGIPTRLVGQGA